jgi:hypothetical protein
MRRPPTLAQRPSLSSQGSSQPENDSVPRSFDPSLPCLTQQRASVFLGSNDQLLEMAATDNALAEHP